MIEGLPWPAQVGVAGLGWLLAFLMFYGLYSGRIITRREADLDRERVRLLEEANRELNKQNTMLLQSAIPTVNAVLTALHDAADDRGPT